MTGYRFGDFVLDGDTRQLLRHGRAVHLAPKAFQLLQVLVEAAPRALSKSELQEHLWPDTFVVEANLHHLVVEVRGALGDDPRRPRYVRTVYGFGYAFQETSSRAPTRTARERVCRLRWDGGRFTLPEGEYIVGRDPSADVILDSASVSRRHARIRNVGDHVTLEDLGSKNGSFVGSQKVEGTVRLADGDEIRIGMVPLSVRISAGVASTETVIRSSRAG